MITFALEFKFNQTGNFCVVFDDQNISCGHGTFLIEQYNAA
jgi:hypothetical protein